MWTNFFRLAHNMQASQPQNTENLETDAKKSGDFSKNVEIDRPADKTKYTQALKLTESVFSCLLFT